MKSIFGWFFANRPMRQAIVISFIFLFLMPTFLLAGVLAYRSSLDSRDQLAERLNDNALAVTRAIEAYIARHEQGVELLAANLAPGVRETPSLRDSVLERNQLVFDGFLNMALLDSAGDIEAVALSERLRLVAPPVEEILGSSVADREYFYILRDGASVFVSDVFQGRGIGDDWLIAMSARLTDREGAFSGGVVGFLDLSRFGDLWQQHQRVRDARLTVLDPRHRVIFSSHSEHSGDAWASHLMARWLDQGITGQTTEWLKPDPEGVQSHLFAIQPMEGGWHALVSLPAERYHAVFWQQLVTMAAFVFLAVALTWLAVWGAGRGITQPMDQLVRHVRRFGDDRERWRASNPIRNAPSEVNELAQGFNDVAIDLLDSLASLQSANDQERSLRSELESIVQDREREIERRTQELKERSEQLVLAANAKSAFLANMSHEMRTPLTAIIGFVEMMLDDPASTGQSRRQLSVVLENSRHLLRLISDVLDFSKIESGKLQLDWQKVDLGSVLDDIHRSQSVLAKMRNLKFELSADAHVPAWIYTDPTRLRQILFNLTGNAIKFTHDGEVRLHASCNRSSQLRIDVIDTGIGIDQSSQQQLFTRFQQADSSVTRHYGGTGLGLAISRQLAEALGGELTLRSSPGEGSTFSLILPVGLSAEAAGCLDQLDSPQCRQEQSRHDDAVAGLTGQVLLADDNPDNQELIAYLLKRRRLSVTVVGNGREAVAAARSQRFDLILMDMHMPVLGGLEAVEEIREFDADTPIVALTADVIPEHRRQQLNAGCDDILAKPIDRDNFDSLLSRYLRAEQSHPTDSRSSSTNSAFTAALSAKFRANLDRYVNPIRQAEQECDPQLLQNALHNLTGSAGSFGLWEISRRSAKVAKRLRDSDQDVRACHTELAALYEQVAREQALG